MKLKRMLLDETGGGLGQAPFRFVQVSIDDDGGLNVNRDDLFLGVLRQGGRAQAPQSQGNAPKQERLTASEVLLRR